MLFNRVNEFRELSTGDNYNDLGGIQNEISLTRASPLSRARGRVRPCAACERPSLRLPRLYCL